MSLCLRERINLGDLILRKARRIWPRFSAIDVRNMGTTREIVLSSRRTIPKEREEAHIIEEVEEAEKKKSKKEEVKYLYYD